MNRKMGTFLFYFFILAVLSAATAGCGGGPREEGGAALPAAGPEFGYPVEGEPWYFVKCGFVVPNVPADLGAEFWSVERVEVDGVRSRDFLVFQGGREIDRNALKAVGGAIALDVKVRANWRPQRDTPVRIELVEAKSGKKIAALRSGTAPSGGGYWDTAWRSYLSLVLTEEHGFARAGYPVHATVGVLSSYLGSPDEVRVVQAERAGADVAYREVPSQVYDVVAWNDPAALAAEEKDAVTGAKIVRYHPTTTFSVAFLADVAAGAKATYLVFYDNPGAPRPPTRPTWP